MECSRAPSGAEFGLGEAARDVHGRLGVPDPLGFDEQGKQRGPGLARVVIEQGVPGDEMLGRGVGRDGGGAGQGQCAVENSSRHGARDARPLYL
ncbi:hypothetical protein [Streptomyces sp. NPDC088115]|uniref:hypothetical protein n=1 Tax=Streptomyces sp. NPDC088115 TaxID=3365824 RepID=UPI003803240D